MFCGMFSKMPGIPLNCVKRTIPGALLNPKRQRDRKKFDDGDYLQDVQNPQQALRM